MWPDKCPKQITSLYTAVQVGRYSDGSQSSDCSFNITHWSFIKRADSSLSWKEEILERGKKRGICPLFVCRYWPSGEKAAILMGKEWPSSMLWQEPVAVSHSHTILSLDADATSWPSGENATALMVLEWPSSILRQASQSSPTFDIMLTHSGIWSANVFHIIVISGAKIRAEE